MSSIDWKFLISLLCKKDLNKEEFTLLKEECRKIIKQAISFMEISWYSIQSVLQKLYGPDYIEVLTQELILKLFKNKEMLKNLEIIQGGYIIKMAKNLILYELSSNKTISYEMSLYEMSQVENDKEADFLNRPELCYTIDYLESLLIEEGIRALKKHLNRRELETLCYIIFKFLYKEKFTNLTIKPDIYYKRWERLKQKLHLILGPLFEPESMENKKNFLEKILSELCYNLNYNK